MKQLFMKNGEVLIKEKRLEIPEDIDGHIIQTKYSCISPGTELSLLRATEKRTGREYPVGYSIYGYCEKEKKYYAGAGVGYANHASEVFIPKNLSAEVGPKERPEYATTTLGAIVLQGIGRADIEIGDNIAVIGLGAIGMITMEILTNCGIFAYGYDIDTHRIIMAGDLGYKVKPVVYIEGLEQIAGPKDYYDKVIICASGKDNKDIVHQACEMCRKKGKVVIVGDVKLDFDRRDIYKKELDILISASYGPGRYDPNYEEKGIDYPEAYVRYTEQRNMYTYAMLIRFEMINISKMIEIYPIEKASEAYQLLGKKLNKKPLILLKY